MLLPISSSFSCQASCVDSQTDLFMLAAFAQDFAGLLRTFFFENFKNAAVDEGCSSSKKLPSLDFSKGLELGLMFSLNVVIRVAARSFSCDQSNSEYFLDRWAVFFVLHPFSCQMPTAVEQFEMDCWSCFNWLKFYNLQPGWDVSNLLIFFSTDERCYSSLYQKQILIVVMLIWISLCRQKFTELLETEDLNVTCKISFKWDTLSHQSIKFKIAW